MKGKRPRLGGEGRTARRGDAEGQWEWGPRGERAGEAEGGAGTKPETRRWRAQGESEGRGRTDGEERGRGAVGRGEAAGPGEAAAGSRGARRRGAGPRGGFRAGAGTPNFPRTRACPRGTGGGNGRAPRRATRGNAAPGVRTRRGHAARRPRPPARLPDRRLAPGQAARRTRRRRWRRGRSPHLLCWPRRSRGGRDLSRAASAACFMEPCAWVGTPGRSGPAGGGGRQRRRGGPAGFPGRWRTEARRDRVLRCPSSHHSQ